MRPPVLAALVALVLPLAAPAAAPAQSGAAVPAYIRHALNDPARQADRADDARRKAAEVLAFAGVKPGEKVLELVPGSGYWTRMFSAVVGPKGHVYTVWPDEMAKYSTKSLDDWRKLSATPHYANVSVLEQPAAQLDVPAKVDLVFTAQNYHDYHDPFMGPVDMAKSTMPRRPAPAWPTPTRCTASTRPP
jgi:predicted methyltransferase